MTALIKKFPVYVIRVGTGYATISTPHSPEDAPEFAVLVFSGEKPAEQFISDTSLEDAEVRYVRNERELARVLVPQRDPVTHVALDAKLEAAGHLTLICIPIPEMLHKHLLKARSPWDYPVFFLELPGGGFAGIKTALPESDGAPPDGEAKNADKKNAPPKSGNVIALFSTNQKAKTYRQGMNHPSGVKIFPVDTPVRLREILREAAKDVFAVALDPIITEDGLHKTPQCMELEKFLVTFLL